MDLRNHRTGQRGSRGPERGAATLIKPVQASPAHTTSGPVHWQRYSATEVARQV